MGVPASCRLAAVCGQVLIVNQYHPRGRRKPFRGLDMARGS